MVGGYGQDGDGWLGWLGWLVVMCRMGMGGEVMVMVVHVSLACASCLCGRTLPRAARPCRSPLLCTCAPPPAGLM